MVFGSGFKTNNKFKNSLKKLDRGFATVSATVGAFISFATSLGDFTILAQEQIVPSPKS